MGSRRPATQWLPFLVISPFARKSYVSNSLIDTTSALKFIKDNWLGGQRTGAGSFGNICGAINDTFTFGRPSDAALSLNPKTGEVAR